MLVPPAQSTTVLPSKVLNAITSAESVLPCEVTYSKVLGVRMRASLGGGRIVLCTAVYTGIDMYANTVSVNMIHAYHMCRLMYFIFTHIDTC